MARQSYKHLNLEKIAKALRAAIDGTGTDNNVVQRIARMAQRYGSEFVNELNKKFGGEGIREALISDHDGGEDAVLAAFGYATDGTFVDTPSESDAKQNGALDQSNFDKYGVGGSKSDVQEADPDYTYDENNEGHKQDSDPYFNEADKGTESNPEGVDWGQAHPSWPKDADGKPLPKDANGNPVMPKGDQQSTPDPKLDPDGNPISSKPEAPAEQEKEPAEDETVKPEDAAPKGPPAAAQPDPRQEEIKGIGRGLNQESRRKDRQGNPGSSIPNMAGDRDRAAIEDWRGKKLKRMIKQDQDMDRKNDIIRAWVDSIKGPGAYDAATPEERANAAANYIAKSKASPTHPDNNPDFVPKAPGFAQQEADKMTGGPSARADAEVRRILDERKARGEDVASTDTYEGNRPKATASMDDPGEVVAEGQMANANVSEPPKLEEGTVTADSPAPSYKESVQKSEAYLDQQIAKTPPGTPEHAALVQQRDFYRKEAGDPSYPPPSSQADSGSMSLDTVDKPQPKTQIPPADSDPTAGLPPVPPKPGEPRTQVPPADSDPTAGLPPVPPKPTVFDDPSIPDYSDKIQDASPINDPNTPDYSDKITDVPDYSDKIVDAPHPTLDDPSVPDYSDKIVDAPSPINDPNVPDYSDKIVDVPSPINDPNVPDYSDKIVDVPKPGDKAREYLANLEEGIDKRPDGAAPATPAPAPAPAPVVSMDKPAQDPSRSHSTPEGRERPITQTELLFNSIRDHYARMGEDISGPNSSGMEKARRDFTLMQNQWKNMHPAEKDNFINSKIMSHNEHRPNPLTGNQQDIDDYKNKRDMDNMDWRGRMQSVGLGQEDMVRKGVNQDILDRTGGRGPSFHANPKYGNAKAAGDAYQDWRGGLTPSQTKQHDDFLFPEGRLSPAAIMETKRRDIINDDMVNRVPKFSGEQFGPGGSRAEQSINDFNKKSRYEQSKRLGMNHLTNSFL